MLYFIDDLMSIGATDEISPRVAGHSCWSSIKIGTVKGVGIAQR